MLSLNKREARSCFFDKSVNRQILGIEVPTSVLLSLNPIFVLICSPFLVLFSEKVLEKKRSIDGFIKIGAGFFLTGLSFLILALGCYQEDPLIPLLWVVAAFLIQTMGELLIVPIGYSNISKLSPPPSECDDELLADGHCLWELFEWIYCPILVK